MTPEQFAYWLNGFAELNPSMEQPTAEQWKSITDHLKTVFVKVTPPVQEPQKVKSVETIEDAMRRFNEQQQRAPSPYGPTISYFGQPMQITC